MASEPQSAEVGVRADLVAVACPLAVPCEAHPLAHRVRVLRGDIAGENLERDALHAHREVDPVAQGAGQPIVVPMDVGLAAPAAVERLAGVPARSGVHCPDEQEAGRELHGTQGPRDSDSPVLEWFPQRLQGAPLELHDLVEKQDAVVSEADLAGPWIAPARRR